MKPINLTYEEASAILELAENSIGGCDDTDDSDTLDVLSTPEDVATFAATLGDEDDGGIDWGDEER